MAINKRKSITNGSRGYSSASFEELTKGAEAPKSLLAVKSKTGGRSHGKISVRHIGGGNRQKYRIIDWKRNKDGIPSLSTNCNFFVILPKFPWRLPWLRPRFLQQKACPYTPPRHASL